MHFLFYFEMVLKFERTIVVAKTPFKGAKNNGIVFMGFIFCAIFFLFRVVVFNGVKSEVNT